MFGQKGVDNAADEAPVRFSQFVDDLDLFIKRFVLEIQWSDVVRVFIKKIVGGHFKGFGRLF